MYFNIEYPLIYYQTAVKESTLYKIKVVPGYLLKETKIHEQRQKHGCQQYSLHLFSTMFICSKHPKSVKMVKFTSTHTAFGSTLLACPLTCNRCSHWYIINSSMTIGMNQKTFLPTMTCQFNAYSKLSKLFAGVGGCY